MGMSFTSIFSRFFSFSLSPSLSLLLFYLSLLFSTSWRDQICDERKYRKVRAKGARVIFSMDISRSDESDSLFFLSYRSDTSDMANHRLNHPYARKLSCSRLEKTLYFNRFVILLTFFFYSESTENFSSSSLPLRPTSQIEYCTILAQFDVFLSQRKKKMTTIVSLTLTMKNFVIESIWKKKRKSTFTKFSLNKNTWNTNLFFDVDSFFKDIVQFLDLELIFFD